jgi:hypothetical protein
MGIIAYVEFTGAAKLKQLNAEAPRKLAFNQLALAALLIGYATWSLYTGLSGPSALMSSEAAQDPMVAEMLAPYEGIERQITALVYIVLILVAIFAQGGTALFYFSRTKYVKAYVQETPAWIVAMQRAGFGL